MSFKVPKNLTLRIVAAALWTAIGLYAFLGIYSRYLADDYCEASLGLSPIAATFQRYVTPGWPRETVRYSNLFFAASSEYLGANSIPITMPLLIILWSVGIVFLIREIRRTLQIDIGLQEELFLSALFIFSGFLLAPNLFQTIYWRSSAMTHFAPLIFGAFLGAFLLRLFRQSEQKRLSPFVYFFIFVLSFIFAGFSEPPSTTAFSACLLAFAAPLFWDRSQLKWKKISLLCVALIGIGAGLAAMIFAPAVSDFQRAAPINLFDVLLNSWLRSFEFVLHLTKSAPLPLSVCFFLALGFAWMNADSLFKNAARISARRLSLYVLAAALIDWTLVAASFAPSVYGQGYPEARARFLGVILFVAFILFLGIASGLLLARFSITQKTIWQNAALILFIAVGAFYPLRRASVVYATQLPEYRERAALWDARQALIERRIAQGKKNLIVPSLDGVYGIKELDENPNHWVNACAARFYGIRSIRVVGVSNLKEALDE